jgi:hypothetical protein
MSGRLDAREIDDLGEMALSATEVKALSSGNPLLMEKAKADAEVSRLVRLERAHGQAQNMLKHRISQDAKQLEALRGEIPHLEAAIAKRIDTRGDQFRMQVGDRLHSERADAARALAIRMTEVLNAPRWDASDHPVGQLCGHELTAKRQYRDDQPYVLVEVSSRAGSHRPALAEPDLSLSAHPAPIAQPSGRAPRRQCANSWGERRAISPSQLIARRSRRVSRLYLRQAHRARCRLSRRRK